MASSSTSSSTSPGLVSRFSGLKVFRFSKDKDKDGRPPPPPPKDDFYLRSRSMASLLPDSMSLAPNSPLSPQHFQYPAQSPDANQSTMSLVSSAASALSSPPPESKSRPQSRGKERALAFLNKISRRSEPPDDGISMPWNFQHNIHVDDGLGGLPPSWSTSLAARGFTEEEISQLLLRRSETRSPNSQALFNQRPNSPTIAHPYLPSGPAPLLTNPAPRTTSLPRQYSDTSLRSNQPRPPPLPFPHKVLSTSASASTSSLHSNKAGSTSSKSRLVPQRHPNTHQHSYSSDSNYSGSGKEDGPPASFTPPRKTSDVASSRSKSIPASSSYPNGQPRNEATLANRLFGSQPPSLPQLSHSFFRPRANAEPDSSVASSSSPPQLQPIGKPSIQSKRTASSAPRLSISLHNHTDSSDLSSWAGALLDGLASGDLEGQSTFNQPTPPESAPTKPAVPTAPGRPTQTQLPARNEPPIPEPTPAKGPAVRLRPLSKLLEGEDDADSIWSPDLASSSSPLWSQLEGILGQPMALMDHSESEEHGPYSAALEETFSPILPFSPEEERMAAQRRMRTDDRARGMLERAEEEDDHRLSVNTMRPNRDSSRSSTSTISTNTILGLSAPTIVRTVSIARRAGAYVIDKSRANRDRSPAPPPTSSLPTPPTSSEDRYPPSPLSSQFDSEEGYNQDSTPSSAQSQEAPTPTSDACLSPLQYYLQPSPNPSQVSFSPVSYKDHEPDSNWDDEEDEDDEESNTSLVVPPNTNSNRTPSPNATRPTIIISGVTQSDLPAAIPSATPLSPFQRYRGWLSEVVAPLEDYIDESVDPRDHYTDLKEIAEGESGSVYSARLSPREAHRLRLPPLVKAKDCEDIANGRDILVAIKSVAIVPSGSPKLNDLRHELSLMRGLCQENLISLDALYVDLLEDTLWIRMELMERSLADVVALVDEGLMLQDRTMARFAGDILKGLEYLQQHNIAHRDIRSDNLLLNKQGVLKITDFAHAVQAPANNPMRDDPAGVLYWQAPEIRSPPYNTLKVDVWSLGATVWEMAETQPPFADTNQFADRWPSVQQPEIHSPAFHEFLEACSEPAATRPSATELLESSFINNACGRPVIVHLLSQCIAIEATLA